ncbi:MAG: hypothetical protein K1W14_06605 [Muribaculaceae bacterium]
MKWNININQKAAVDNGLNVDIIDLAIYDFIKSFINSRNCNKIDTPDGVFYRISHAAIIEQMPLLGIKSKRAIVYRINKLIDAKLLEKSDKCEDFGMSLYRFGVNYDKIEFANSSQTPERKAPPMNENATPHEQKFTPPMNENAGYNNISNNINKNNISTTITRTCEERDLIFFDKLVAEMTDDSQWQIWKDQIRMKLGVENIKDYLPSFRDHVILNGKLSKINSMAEFQSYFTNTFKYLNKQRPIEILAKYTRDAKSEEYKTFCNWLKDKAPNVAAEMIPPTEDEFWELKNAFGSPEIGNAVLEIGNREYRFFKRYSLFQTLKTYFSNEYNKS